jgi:hypothetical protein
MSVKEFNLGKDGLRRQGEGTELKKRKQKKSESEKWKGKEGGKEWKRERTGMRKEDGRNGRKGAINC